MPTTDPLESVSCVGAEASKPPQSLATPVFHRAPQQTSQHLPQSLLKSSGFQKNVKRNISLLRILNKLAMEDPIFIFISVVTIKPLGDIGLQ